VARFRLQAQAPASLDHADIAASYGLEESLAIAEAAEEPARSASSTATWDVIL
jgi:hypothetical protein